MRNSNGLGTVTKLSGKRRKPYAARITTDWDGKRQKQTAKYIGYYATREEALAALLDYHRHPVDLDARKLTVKEVFAQWLATSPALSAGRIAGLTSAFNKCARLHRLPYAALRVPDLRAAMATAAPNTRGIIKALFKHLDQFAAYELEIIEKKYSEALTIPTPPRQKEAHLFTASEIARLWERAGDSTAAAVLILLYSGWRASELLSLKKTDIDLETGTMRGGLKTDAGRGGRGGRGRLVPIHSAILPIITRLMITSGGAGEYLINNELHGGALAYLSFRYRFVQLVKTLELEPAHRLHDTRHTFRSALDRVNAPISLACVNKIMGHKCGDVGLNTYTHKTLEDLRRTVELVNYGTDADAPEPDSGTVQMSIFTAAV